MMSKIFDLFWSFLMVGSFSFGGAYSLIPLIENEVVQKNGWITHDEFLKVLGMVEVIPGAISIKFATYTGYKVAGIPGVIAANIGNMITPVVLILVVSALYLQFAENKYVMKAFQGVKFLIIGMIIAVMVKYIQKQFTVPVEFVFILLGFALVFFFKFNPILVVGIGIVISLILL